MIEGELQFITMRDGDGAEKRVACRLDGAVPGAPAVMWFPGFKSHMEGTKALAVAQWSKSRGVACLRFDYSGHGQSDGRFEDGTVGQWLAEAEAVLRAAPLAGPPVFVGSSMGAWIALLLARRLTGVGAHRPRAMVLIAPAWDMTRLMWERGSDEDRAALQRNGVYRGPGAPGQEPHTIALRLIEEGKSHLFGGGPIEAGCPVRIVHGQRDADIPWQHSLDLIRVLAVDDVRLTLVKDGEHHLSRPQDLGLLFAAIDEFLA